MSPFCVKKYMEEFKPKKKRISQQEKAELLALNLKWCGRCKEAMALNLFSSVKRKVCRACSKKMGDKWKSANPERARSTLAAWKAENSEKQKVIQKNKYIENPEPRRRQSREWHNRNKEQVSARRKERYYANHEKSREWCNRWEQNERKTNPLYALTERIRKRTRYSFKHKKISKNQRTQEMLGCSWEELKTHIENQFTGGMSWDRLGEIHIDHIIPLASATTEEELIKLAHYTNLQPMWAKDNISKGCRF